MAAVMAEAPVRAHRRGRSSISSLRTGDSNMPKIEMMPNPEFSFPRLPQAPQGLQPDDALANRRPMSMQSNAPPMLIVPNTHKRAASTLPSFSFNAADASGRQEDTLTPPLTPDEGAPTTPSRRGHKRAGSELVGGDSRKGVNSAISSSPTKTNALPLPIPAGPPAPRRGHAHRRSAAMSSHDVSDIMQPRHEEPRLSSSLPNSPLEHPQSSQFDRSTSAPDVSSEPVSPFGPPLPEPADARPPSRPRVGFSDNVEIIPRPLSTISSETESSMSTVRGHSVNNSISSMLSLGSPSPPSLRNPRTSLSTTFEDEAKPRSRSSLEVSNLIEKEGQWLRSSTSSSNMKRPLSESAASSPNLTFDVPDSPVKPRDVHGKKHSIGHALGFDRRRSEPAISIQAQHLARLSALSLHDEPPKITTTAAPALERKTSAKKIKIAQFLKLSKKAKEPKRDSVAGAGGKEPELLRPQTPEETDVPGKVPLLDPSAAFSGQSVVEDARTPASQPPVAETNLDAVFSDPVNLDDANPFGTPHLPRFEASTPTPSYTGSFGSSKEESDGSPLLDLDAALGPFQTPGFTGHRLRRGLHSSRGTKDFGGGPGAYSSHRRAESAPELPPWGFTGGNMTSLTSLPDVFEGEGEEEAEEEQAHRPASSRSAQDEAGTGIQVVDTDMLNNGSRMNFNDGLRIQRGEWEPERPSTSHGTASSRLWTPTIERRPSSTVEETIPEELSPVEPVEIVEADEEPRASSLTKSSDSSETPTILASQTGSVPVPNGAPTLMTPDTFQTSTFSSPDHGRRQGSFETSSRLGTSASSIADNRTMSSCNGEPPRMSSDGVPSLTGSMSTMASMMNANSSRRDVSAGERSTSDSSGVLRPTVSAEKTHRGKRGSIMSLSQLTSGSFSGKNKTAGQARPQTAGDFVVAKPPKKEHRLKKLMFWRSKSKQSLRSDS